LRLLLFPAILCLAAGSAAADPPFVPADVNPPDYVVTMVESLYGKEAAKRNVAHHGGWTRIDRIEDTYRSVVHFSVNGVAGVHDQRSVSSTSFTRGFDLSYRGHAPRNTGERQTHLGETCTVWEVSRPGREVPSGSGLFHLSCITDDGIELWQRSIYGSNVITSAEATRVERRTVAPDEVKPPRTLLTLDWWDREAPMAGSAILGSETIMELSGQSADAGKSIRTTRQRGQWQSMEETVSGVRRRLEIVHDSGRMGFEYAYDELGAPKRLTITRPASTPEDTATTTSAMWNETNRSETILGETCRWFHLMAMGDFGRSRCLTNDGVTLKDHWRLRGLEGVVQEWTAVRITRIPVNLDEIKPSAELLDPHVWGIE
jgi:hypothetical protein